MVARNLQRKVAKFDKAFVSCPNEIEVEDEAGNAVKQTCGSTLWDKKQLHGIYHVPEVVCGRAGGAVMTEPRDFFRCASCGYALSPDEWKHLAFEAFTAGGKKVFVPGDIKTDKE